MDFSYINVMLDRLPLDESIYTQPSAQHCTHHGRTKMLADKNFMFCLDCTRVIPVRGEKEDRLEDKPVYEERQYITHGKRSTGGIELSQRDRDKILRPNHIDAHHETREKRDYSHTIFMDVLQGLTSSVERTNSNIEAFMRCYKPFAIILKKDAGVPGHNILQLFSTHIHCLHKFSESTNIPLDEFMRKINIGEFISVALGICATNISQCDISAFEIKIPPEYEPVIRKHSTICLRLFEDIRQHKNLRKIRMTFDAKSTPNNTKHGFSYCFYHHVIAYLYLAAEGMRTIMEPCPVLNKLLPPYHTVHRFIEATWTNGQHRKFTTKCPTRYRSFIRTLLHDGTVKLARTDPGPTHQKNNFSLSRP